MASPEVPGGLSDWMRSVDRQLQALQKASPLRNASITGGNGLSIREGGSLKIEGGGGLRIRDGGGLILEDQDGTPVTYIGGLTGGQLRPDGTPQPAFVQYRDDGTVAISVYDPVPGDAYQQFVALWDRAGNWVVTDDTASGQGIGRPYLPAPFYRARYTDWPSSTAAAFETVWRGGFYKQHPKIYMGVRHTSDASGTTGEVQVLVNGVQVGDIAPVEFLVSSSQFGPAVVPGVHLASLDVEIRARRTAGTGAVRCEPSFCYGAESGLG